MSHTFNRRDFLIMSALLPLLTINWGEFVNKPKYFIGKLGTPNILIILFDALSARHISLQGYRRETTPNLARFAERATVFHRHYAAGNFTTPSTASIFTGTYPWTHRAFNIRGLVTSDYVHRNLFSLSPSNVDKIAYSHNHLPVFLLHQFQDDLDVLLKTRELSLVDNQYSDQLFFKDYPESFWSENLILRGSYREPASLFSALAYRILKFLRKQEVVDEYGSQYPKGLPNNLDIYFLLKDGIDWIIAQVSSLPHPYLAYFHFFPPHTPDAPPSEFVGIFDDGYMSISKPPSKFTENRNVETLLQRRWEYDEYIAYVDAEFGRLIDSLTQEGVLDDTMVIFASDHGELFERNIHGHTTETLYEPLIHVPLLISNPGQSQQKDVYSPTSGVDQLPTLLHTYGQDIPDWCEGEILSIFRNQEQTRDRSIHAMEFKRNSKFAPLTKGTIALSKEQFKLVHFFGYEGVKSEYELFNLENDPEELENPYPSEKSIAAALQSELMTKLDEVNQQFK